MTKMSVKEFLEQNNGSPIDREELAQRAAEVRGKLGEAAQAFLDAADAFEAELERVGYEPG